MVKTPSVEPVVRSRLLPQVSFKFALGVTALVAVFASLARVAGEGGALAMSLVAFAGYLAITFVGFAALFLISWAISSLWYEADDESLKGSPFADGQLPPQILPPRENKS